MRDKIRVLYFYPYLNFDTGSPKAMVQFIDLLDRSLFTPIFYAIDTGPLTQALSERDVEILQGEAISLTFEHPFAGLAAVRRQAELLKSWKIDLLHANCFAWNPDLVFGARMSSIPAILHVHNPVDFAFRNVSRFAAAKILFCSRAVMQNCGNLHRVASQAEVFHNVIDVESWSHGTSIRSSLGIREGEIAIGTVAQIVHRKGIDILLETARLLLLQRSDLVFLVAGPQTASEAEFGRSMQAAADESPLRGRVRFLGSRTDISDFASSLDLFLFPTRAEPLGIAILEAMAAGLPVVASNVGGIPEIITSPDMGVLVDPITPEAFAGAVQAILARPDRGKSIGAKAQQALIGRFDIVTGRERLQNIYLDVLGPRGITNATDSGKSTSFRRRRYGQP
jgi:glycosyltransferase involved in cell wall biosynthesis